MRGDDSAERVQTMSSHCPSCGSEVEVTPRAIEIEAGTCPGCSRAFLLLPPNADLTTSVVSSVPGTEPAGDDDEEELSAVCAECGGTLVLAVDGENALNATCDDCNTVFRLVRADAPERPAPRRMEDAPERPSRSRDSDRGDDRPSPRREFDSAGPPSRARPCRKCGGPIVFSDGEDGGMVGTCQSCGNRFSLRPRTDGGGSRDRGFSSGPRSRGPPPWKSGGGSGGGYRGGGGGTRRPRSDSYGDDERPRRRRRDD
jgi:DNA-directed RNA polymerase subunit M/transcription elongation factor TFIIS